MNETIKRHLISSGVTFLATFLSVVGTTILTVDATNWSGAVVASVIVSAARAALKVVVEKYISTGTK